MYIEADEKVEGNIRLEAVSVDAEQLEHLDNEKVSFYQQNLDEESAYFYPRWWANLPLLLRLDKDEAVENR